jgi:hypothetical protein
VRADNKKGQRRGWPSITASIKQVHTLIGGGT